MTHRIVSQYSMQKFIGDLLELNRKHPHAVSALVSCMESSIENKDDEFAREALIAALAYSAIDGGELHLHFAANIGERIKEFRMRKPKH